MERKAATTFQRVLVRNFIIQDVRKYLQSLCRKQDLYREHTNSSINATVTKAFSEQVGRLYAQTITKAVLQRAKSLWKMVEVTGYASEDRGELTRLEGLRMILILSAGEVTPKLPPSYTAGEDLKRTVTMEDAWKSPSLLSLSPSPLLPSSFLSIVHLIESNYVAQAESFILASMALAF